MTVVRSTKTNTPVRIGPGNDAFTFRGKALSPTAPAAGDVWQYDIVTDSWLLAPGDALGSGVFVPVAGGTMTGLLTLDAGLATGTIAELTADAGVTVDGLLIKDGGIPAGAVTAHQAALSFTQSQITDLSSTTDLAEGTNLYYTEGRFDSSLAGKSTSDLSEGTGLFFTDERVDDRVAALLQTGGGLSWSYNDGSNTLTPVLALTNADVDAGAAIVASKIAAGTFGAGAYTFPDTLDVAGAKLTVNSPATSGDVATGGIVINQTGPGGSFAVKLPSGVSHTMTGIAEADTYGLLQTSQGDSGGFVITGLKDNGGSAGLALWMRAFIVGATEVSKLTSSIGNIVLDAAKGSGVGVGVLSDNANMVVMRSNQTAKFIFSERAEMHTLGAGGTSVYGSAIKLAGDITRITNSGTLTISGGDTTSAGGNIQLRGGTASNNGDILFRAASTTKLQWDQSASKWIMSADFDVTGALTSTGLITANAGVLSLGLLRVSGSADTNRTVQFETAGVRRWQALTNADAEAGGDVGSDFQFIAYSDAGALLGVPLKFIRGTLASEFGGLITATTGVKYGTTVTLTEGAANRLDLAAGDSLNIVSGTLTVGGAASITGIVTSPIGSAWRLGQDAVTAHLAGNVGSVALTIADGGGISGVFVDNSHNGTFSAQAILFKVAEGGVTATFEAARVSKRGNFLIGTTSDPTANDSKVLVLGDNTADPTFAAGTAGLWNNGGTLKTAGTFQADSLLLGTTVVLSEGIANRLDLVAGDSFNIVSGNLTVGGGTTLTYDSGATVPLTFADSNAGGETWRAGSGINALTSFGWFNVDQSLAAMTLSNTGVLSVNQLDGPSGNHLILNAPATAGFILMQNQGVETLRLGPDGSVAFPRTGPHAIGGVIDSRIGLLVGGAITSVGSGIGVGTALQHALTGAPGDIQSLAMVHIRGNINTQTATESIGIVASLLVDDPLIINNLTGTIPVAASIYIKAAPTEGVVNAALFIAGGSLDIGTTSLFEGAADRLDLASGDSFLAVNGSINIGALVAGFDFALSLDGAGAPRGMMIRNTGTAAGDDARLVFETQASRTMGMGLDRSTGLFAFAGNADLVTSLAMTIDPLNGNMKTFGDHLVAGNLGLFGGAAVAKPTGVTVDIAAVHAALITLNLIGV